MLRCPNVGRLIFHILMTVAQFEREWSNERSMHGLMKARERGTLGGRHKTYTDEQITDAMAKAKNNYEKAAKLIGARKITMIRRWKKLKDEVAKPKKKARVLT
jgi:DNA invertase Pin-like site-specific DNA recombinase